ncbi:hypothetical protein C2S53_012247 [Perilla frutescens var. hirtella]|uniref:PGG domain-containing protein n=1 Tax=Perilla frutescens var. hirtella TaxID=608512 RepID=A0AAD4P4V1_PERFH|nr:hypothetical protein C2S53_012247 [Perilla frutescens var. hirtella]
MEKLQTKLFEAATQGSISSLQQLLNDDPLILDRDVVNSFNETPLHVAAMIGHVDFVKEIIQLKPQLINELNLQQSSPLHLASAKGHVDVVRFLLSVDKGACLARDRNELTPLHLAASKGRVEAMKLLLQAQPDAARVTVYGGENILHLCVKRYQLEALKLVVEAVGEPHELVNSKDVDGNTVLHLVVADKQVETTKFLVSVGGVEVNAVNNEGMTPLDVLIRSRRDVRDSKIEESLKQARGFGSNMETSNNNTPLIDHKNQNNNSWGGLMKQHSEWLEQTKSTLMIVAVLIATMAFQVGVNPPGGVWQENKLLDSQGNPVPDPQTAGESVLAKNYPALYDRFYIANTTSFVASLSIILLLISGLPLRRRFFMWILIVITWIAITALALCYAIAVYVVTPGANVVKGEEPIVWVILIVIYGWLILMALLLIAHTIRMIVKLVKKIRKAFRRRRFAAAAAAPPQHGDNITTV